MYHALAKSEWKCKEQVSGNETVPGNTVRNRTDHVLPPNVVLTPARLKFLLVMPNPRRYIVCIF